MAKRMSGQKAVTPDANALEASAKAAGKGGLPPVHLWNPPYCGDLDIRIHRDGSWSYLGSPINRFELVKLFSSILKLEGGKFYLVTPVEKVGITVEDAPFVAVDFEATGAGESQVLTFTTQVGDQTIAGPDNPVRVERDPNTGEPSPYVHVRAGLEALIDRKSFYRLMEIGEAHEGWFGLWSQGCFFRIIEADALDLA